MLRKGWPSEGSSVDPVHDDAEKDMAGLLENFLNNRTLYMVEDKMRYTVMHKAAKVGSVEYVRAVFDTALEDESLKKEVLSMLRKRGKDGLTPLMLAVLGRHWEVFRTMAYITGEDILTRAVELAYKESNNIAASDWNEPQLRWHLPSPEQTAEEHFQVLNLSHPIYVASIQDPEFAEAMFRRAADANVRSGTFAVPDLYHAIEAGCEDSVRKLLETKFDMTFRDNDDNSVLHKAAQHGDETIAKLVVDRIKRIKSKSEQVVLSCCLPNVFGDTPLSITVSKQEWGMFEIISGIYTCELAGEESESPLHVSCKQGNLTATQMIIDKFPGLITYQSLEGHSSMNICAQNGDMTMFKFLLAAGGDLASYNFNTGHTLVHYAAFNRNTEILQALLEDFNFSSNIFGHRGDTPLHVAAMTGNLAAVKILLQHGADASATEDGNKLPLEEALYGGFFEVAKVLCEATQKPARNGIILQALRHGDNDFLRLVLEKGFAVHDYSTFWEEVLAANTHDLSLKFELMFEHGIKFLEVRHMVQAFTRCDGCAYINVDHGTFNALLKYGLLEVLSITGPVLKPTSTPTATDCSTGCLELPWELCEVYLNHLPSSIESENGASKPIPKLSHICRWSIRHTLAQRRHVVAQQHINRLPLPNTLKRFLMHSESKS